MRRRTLRLHQNRRAAPARTGEGPVPTNSLEQLASSTLDIRQEACARSCRTSRGQLEKFSSPRHRSGPNTELMTGCISEKWGAQPELRDTTSRRDASLWAGAGCSSDSRETKLHDRGSGIWAGCARRLLRTRGKPHGAGTPEKVRNISPGSRLLPDRYLSLAYCVQAIQRTAT